MPAKAIGHDQRRRGQVVEPRLRIDPALEVAVARQHRRYMQVPFVDRGGDGLGQRPGIADTGRAAVADQIEAEGVQVRLQAGGFQIVGHDLRARRE